MHTKQETTQTVMLNLILRNDGITTEEIKNGMVFAGVWKETPQAMNNAIRALVISLNRYFKKYKIQFTIASGVLHNRSYTATDEAKEFCYHNLLEKMYDEEGEECGYVFQHPITLNPERMELI